MNRGEVLLEWALAIGIDLQISCRTKEERIVSRAGVDFSHAVELSSCV